MPHSEKAAPAGAAYKNNLRAKSHQSHRRKQQNCAVSKKDFSRLNQAALNQLPRFLAIIGVSFREEHHEIVMLNPRRKDTHYGSFRINRRNGRWGDFAVNDVRGGDVVGLVAYLMQIRQGEAAQWVQRVLGGRHG